MQVLVTGTNTQFPTQYFENWSWIPFVPTSTLKWSFPWLVENTSINMSEIFPVPGLTMRNEAVEKRLQFHGSWIIKFFRRDSSQVMNPPCLIGYGNSSGESQTDWSKVMGSSHKNLQLTTNHPNTSQLNWLNHWYHSLNLWKTSQQKSRLSSSPEFLGFRIIQITSPQRCFVPPLRPFRPQGPHH